MPFLEWNAMAAALQDTNALQENMQLVPRSLYPLRDPYRIMNNLQIWPTASFVR